VGKDIQFNSIQFNSIHNLFATS